MNRQLLAAVQVHVDGPLATVTVGTGRRRNALDRGGWRELERQLDTLATTDVAAVRLRGAADTFCAGSDMTEWVGAPPASVEDSFARMEAAFRAVERCPVPVVAEIQGVAAGAGCQLALACDLRVMAESARIGMPIARLGILATPAFAARMQRLAGPSLAAELLYTGRFLDARHAVAAGIAGAALPDAEVAEYVEDLLTRITRQPTAAIRAAKQAVTVATGEPPAAVAPAVDYHEFQRDITAFLGGSAA